MSEYDLNNPQSDVESYLANMDGILAPLPLPPESNVEKYLAHIVGVQGVELPNKPDSRVEAYLEKLALDPPQPVTPVLVEKQITNNGVYSASDDSADGYSKVTVEVPDPVLDELVATVNGEYNPTHDGYSKVTVQVPDPALETLSVTENGEYTPTAYGYSRVTVSVQPPEDSYQLKSITTPTPLATFEASAMPMPSLKVSVEAQQDLHGYDKPWVGGSGKNKLPLTVDTIKSLNTGGTWNNNTYSINGGTLTIMTDNSGNVIGLNINGTFNDSTTFHLINSNSVVFPNNQYILNGIIGGSASTYRYLYLSPSSGYLYSDGGDTLLNLDEGVSKIRLLISSGYNAQNVKVYPMVRLASVTDASFAPYSNICPISGWSEVVVSDVDDVDNPTVTQTTTISLGQTVYGGEVDVVNGVLTITHEIISLTNPSTKNLGKFLFSKDNNTLVENTDIQRPSSDFICDKFGIYSIQEVVSSNKVGVSISKTSGGYYVYDLNTKDMTLEQAQAYYGENPITVRYPLATPIIVPLTPTLIKSLEGTNNLSVDCGEILEGTYLKAL